MFTHRLFSPFILLRFGSLSISVYISKPNKKQYSTKLSLDGSGIGASLAAFTAIPEAQKQHQLH